MKMYFLLNMGIFQPAMLVYQRVNIWKRSLEVAGNLEISTWHPKSFFVECDDVISGSEVKVG